MPEVRRAALALDQGGHATRACVISSAGEVLAEAQVSIRTHHGPAAQVEHDADELAASVSQAAGTALAQLTATHSTPVAVHSAGLVTQRSTLVCFDRYDGRALSTAISWQDRRNAAWLASFASQTRRVRSLTGLPLSPHYGVAKMRWCLEHLPAVQAAARAGRLQMAPLASFLAARLTGQPAKVDPANASRTLLYSYATHDWSEELLRLFGIERDWLPPCCNTRAQFGDLSLSETIALRAVTGDQSAVPFAQGMPDEKALYVNLGTGAFLQRPLRQPAPLDGSLLASVLAIDSSEAWYCLEGTVNGAGSAVQTFLDETGLAADDCWQALEALPATSELPLYINGIGGLGSPYWRSEQPSYFVGTGSPLQRFAAVIESIVFLIAINFDAMRWVSDTPQQIWLSGGLSRSAWLCRRLAAALKTPILRGLQEASVCGAAMLAEPSLAAGAPAAGSDRRFEPDELPAVALQQLRARRARLERELGPSG